MNDQIGFDNETNETHFWQSSTLSKIDNFARKSFGFLCPNLFENHFSNSRFCRKITHLATKIEKWNLSSKITSYFRREN